MFVYLLRDDCISKNNNKKIYLQYPPIRNYLSKLCASIKSNSKLLLGFHGEDLYLLTWKDAHDILWSEKYSIYHMIPIMCNHIHILIFSEKQREMSERQMGNSTKWWFLHFL